VSQGWKGVLDALEAELADAGFAESTDSPAFAPPAQLGPVPPGLVDRAVRLLHRMTEREADLERRRAEVGRQLAILSAAAMTTAAAAARPVPHFFDTTA
jgi:hypothetical protein